MQNEPFTHLDLFTGIAGFILPLQAEGFRTIACAEIDPYACRLLAQRYPHIPNLGDVRKLWLDQPPPDALRSPAIISGGDPCQDNSNACRAADAQEESLGAEYLRIVRLLRPHFVLRENPAVVRRDAPWPYQRFCLHLEALGYYTLPLAASACCFGADHRRDRLFVLAALSHPDQKGLQRLERQILEGTFGRRYHPHAAGPDRRSPSPRICRRADGVPNRVDRLKTLGNAVDPRVVQPIARAIHQILYER